jgi:hypothetical protein
MSGGYIQIVMRCIFSAGKQAGSDSLLDGAVHNVVDRLLVLSDPSHHGGARHTKPIGHPVDEGRRSARELEPRGPLPASIDLSISSQHHQLRGNPLAGFRFWTGDRAANRAERG